MYLSHLQPGKRLLRTLDSHWLAKESCSQTLGMQWCCWLRDLHTKSINGINSYTTNMYTHNHTLHNTMGMRVIMDHVYKLTLMLCSCWQSMSSVISSKALAESSEWNCRERYTKQRASFKIAFTQLLQLVVVTLGDADFGTKEAIFCSSGPLLSKSLATWACTHTVSGLMPALWPTS